MERSRFGKLKVPSLSRDDPAVVPRGRVRPRSNSAVRLRSIFLFGFSTKPGSRCTLSFWHDHSHLRPAAWHATGRSF